MIDTSQVYSPMGWKINSERRDSFTYDLRGRRFRLEQVSAHVVLFRVMERKDVTLFRAERLDSVLEWAQEYL